MFIDKKCTVYGSFVGNMPRTFTLHNSKGELYYKRSLDGRTPRIKFNILHADDYTPNVPFEVLKISELELPDQLPELPDYTRNRVKDVTITFNPNLTGTPARIHTKTGVIERSPLFFGMTKPLRVFILLHEVGHFYYGVNNDDLENARRLNPSDANNFLRTKMLKGEKDCDAFAFVHFLRMGFNRSTAFQALKEVLKDSPYKNERLNSILNYIKHSQNAKAA